MEFDERFETEDNGEEPGRELELCRWKLETCLQDALTALVDNRKAGPEKAVAVQVLAQALHDFEQARQRGSAWSRITGQDMVLVERCHRLLKDYPPAALATEGASGMPD